VHACACVILHKLQFQRVNASYAEVVALITRLVAKISGRILEQRINVKFCVKLWKYARDTCAILSEAYEADAMKSDFEFH
jgi:uncharacterized metal-binding protein